MSTSPGMSRAVPTDEDRSERERLDRTWADLLQELRVIQGGTQLLTGFLLVVAFLPDSRAMTPPEKAVLIVALLLAAVSQVFALAPIPLHRGLFRTRGRTTLLRVSDRCLRLALVGTGLVLTAVAFLVVDRLTGPLGGAVAAVGGFLIGVSLWLLLPLRVRHGRERRPVERR